MIQFVAGPDHRLAVLPSLCGYILTVWCAFLIPRRLLDNGGTIAGLLAALLVAVCPAHRAYATDCMYESLGAGLSLAGIYLYLVALQDGTRRAAIAARPHAHRPVPAQVSLLAARPLRPRRRRVRSPTATWLQHGLSLLPARPVAGLASSAELKQPLNYLALGLAIAAIVVARDRRRHAVASAGWSMSLQEPHNFVTSPTSPVPSRRPVVAADGTRVEPELPMAAQRTDSLARAGRSRSGSCCRNGCPISSGFWARTSDQQRESVPFMHGWSALPARHCRTTTALCLVRAIVRRRDGGAWVARLATT